MTNVQTGDKGVVLPSYDKSRLKAGIVHFGPSHFARAHWFAIIDDYMSRTGDLDWGIVAAIVRKSDKGDTWPRYKQIVEQGCSYHLFEQGLNSDADNKVRRIDSLLNILNAPENPDALYEQIAHPDTKLITTTVTQNGYDLGDENNFTTVYHIVRGLELRYRRGMSGFTIMSLDNIEDNGTKIKDKIEQQAAGNPGLVKWIRENIPFPSTMVDRITPSSEKPEESMRIAKAIGVQDVWPVRTEQFLQLMIKRAPNCSLPALEHVDGLQTVRFTNTVTKYEHMKIRMLNGTHMAMGVIGQLMGYKNSAEALANPVLRQFLQGYMAEAAQTLPDMKRVNFDEYLATNFKRFDRLDPPDDLSRLSRNGTKDKLQPRVLNIAEDLLAAGKDFRHVAFTAAAWAHFLKGVDMNGKLFDIVDKEAVARGWQEIASTKPTGEYIVMLRDIFGAKLSDNRNFRKVFGNYYNLIGSLGIEGAMRMVNESGPVSNVIAITQLRNSVRDRFKLALN